ncbi:MAG: hypothetical protein SO173_07820 [Lachnospiraceae bacterium]|jgi:hypothetical protein|nr:DUF1905 domain-containing protein [Lachnospiraceae bacterium]MCI5881430.1 hypothetical protein [Clostridium sp.]CDA67952.1 putative uncharacterized protein [Clostridium sp. CAG:510]MDD6179833.1 hypothetical protein [Clostridium sp.]MDY4821543.1 hypothetical protein [Lachnospiraceae bacterium]
MRYFFTGKIDKKENGFVIQLPFNVWEVCKLRDEIKADMVLDNEIIACKLLPKEKGNYEIHIEDKDAIKVDLTKSHQMLLHISGSIIEVSPDSPYSFDNPIRKIDSVQVIIQPEDGLCGQTCVAMLAGVTIADVIRVMDCREWQATMGMVISALNYYGIDHKDVITYTEGRDCVLPKCCILMERMGRYCHYLVYFDGKYYDSNLGVLEEYDKSKLLGYLEIKCE